MNGSDFELLSAYLDEELSPQERATLEQRLQHEDDLRREMELLRATIVLIGSLPALKAPRDFTLAAPPRTTAAKVSLFPRLVSLASAAAAVLLVVAGISMLTPSSMSQSATGSMVQDVAALPTATSIPMMLEEVLAAPLPTLSPAIEQLNTTDDALQSEAPLPATLEVEVFAAGGMPAVVGAVPTELDESGSETSSMPAADAAAQESQMSSVMGGAAESSGLAAVTDAKTPADETQTFEMFAQATQILTSTASPEPSSTPTTEPTPQVEQSTARNAAAATEAAEGESQQSVAYQQAESSTPSVIGIIFLTGGALLMLVAIVIFLRSHNAS
ncbi:MAG: hypothetical protein IAE89_14585 [Anaerolineae bacterium]|nr:hypothetical protein [Anaerolineae bacterium]